MSLFSTSSKRNHYKNGNNGSGHYQRKGLLGNLINMLGSRSHSDGYYNNPYGQYPNGQIPLNDYNQPLNVVTIQCTKCGSGIPQGSKFCLQCGEKVAGSLFCTSCGEKLPPNAKFCMKCGQKL